MRAGSQVRATSNQSPCEFDPKGPLPGGLHVRADSRGGAPSGITKCDTRPRVSTETTHFYVDLVFYNYLLKCFVLLDLKTRKLAHSDIGQMDMYVRLFDDLKRGPDDNPTLGIILCTDKDDTLVRYSVLSESQQLFASKYRLVLPSEEELRDELERRHILQLPDSGNSPNG